MLEDILFTKYLTVSLNTTLIKDTFFLVFNINCCFEKYIITCSSFFLIHKISIIFSNLSGVVVLELYSILVLKVSYIILDKSEVYTIL